MEAVPGTDGSHLSRNTTRRPDSKRLAGGAEDLRHVSRKETASAPPRPSGTRARDPNTGGSRCGRGGPAGHPRPRRARPGGRGGGRRAAAPHGGGSRRGRRSPGARSAAPGRPVPARADAPHTAARRRPPAARSPRPEGEWDSPRDANGPVGGVGEPVREGSRRRTGARGGPARPPRSGNRNLAEAHGSRTHRPPRERRPTGFEDRDRPSRGPPRRPAASRALPERSRGLPRTRARSRRLSPTDSPTRSRRVPHRFPHPPPPGTSRDLGPPGSPEGDAARQEPTRRTRAAGRVRGRRRGPVGQSVADTRGSWSGESVADETRRRGIGGRPLGAGPAPVSSCVAAQPLRRRLGRPPSAAWGRCRCAPASTPGPRCSRRAGRRTAWPRRATGSR